MRQPRLTFLAASRVLVDHRELPEVAEQDDAGQLVRVLPHGQDPLEVRCRQHGDLRGDTRFEPDLLHSYCKTKGTNTLALQTCNDCLAAFRLPTEPHQ